MRGHYTTVPSAREGRVASFIFNEKLKCAWLILIKVSTNTITSPVNNCSIPVND